MYSNIANFPVYDRSILLTHIQYRQEGDVVSLPKLCDGSLNYSVKCFSERICPPVGIFDFAISNVPFSNLVGLWCPQCRSHSCECFGDTIVEGKTKLAPIFVQNSLLKPRVSSVPFSSFGIHACTSNIQS